jgi:thiol-disulfide isomerase/thioredoxin
MKHYLILASLLAAPAAGLVTTAFAAPSEAPSSASAADIEKQLNEVKLPAFNRTKGNDAAYAEQFRQELRAASEKRAELIRQLLAARPDHPEAAKLFTERAQFLMRYGKAESVPAEIEAFLATNKNEALVGPMKQLQVAAYLQSEKPDFDKALKLIDELAAASPGDEKVASLLSSYAGHQTDPAKAKAAYERVVKEFGQTRPARMAGGKIKQLDGVGKPFELSFTEAISGKQMSMADLKGKVVVIDFWATWCGPCVAEMPKMKALYAEWKDKGVEFVGVSLDQPEDKGGLKSLKDFVAKNEIGWPQYYQGNYWQSEFSMGWGINAIPAVFIVDADGNLYSTEARGKLETLIPELVAKRDKK